MLNIYCDKCGKKNPENFITCAYCGEKLNTQKKKDSSRFAKTRKRKERRLFKTKLEVLIVLGVVIVVGVISMAIISGSRPEKLVDKFIEAIHTSDKDLYYSIFDDNIKRYKKENRYFGEEETFEQIILPMSQSGDFYKEKCGDDYKLTYKVTSEEILSEEKLQGFIEVLETGFGYIETPSKVIKFCVEVKAKGENGEYKSVYNDFWCMRIKGHWYKVDKTIYSEYINSIKQTSF